MTASMILWSLECISLDSNHVTATKLSMKPMQITIVPAGGKCMDTHAPGLGENRRLVTDELIEFEK